MNIWALSDLHLCFATSNKSMEIFGDNWKNYSEKIKSNWEKTILPDDIVLIAGDISWAMHLEESLTDLIWIDALPGTKILLKGNHDYWWNSLNKMKKVLPHSLLILQNNSFYFNGIAIGGTRLWDSDAITYDSYINTKVALPEKIPEEREKDKKIYFRELERLKLSLSKLNPHANVRIAMTHYPPVGPHLESTPASDLLEKFNIDICVFGHIHNMKKSEDLFGEKNGIKYFLTSSDYLDFMPKKII